MHWPVRREVLAREHVAHESIRRRIHRVEVVAVDRRWHDPPPRAGAADPEADLGARLEAREHLGPVAAPAAAAGLGGIGVAHLKS